MSKILKTVEKPESVVLRLRVRPETAARLETAQKELATAGFAVDYDAVVLSLVRRITRQTAKAGAEK